MLLGGRLDVGNNTDNDDVGDHPRSYLGAGERSVSARRLKRDTRG
jgi:hypothetical protein